MTPQDLVNFGRMLRSVKVADIMTKPVRTVHVRDNFSAVEEIFVNEGIRHLPVVDDSKKLIGIVSQRDVYRAVAPRRAVDDSIVYREGIIVDKDGYYEKESLNKFIINHIMHKDPQTLTADSSAGEAVRIMVRRKLGCVPIIDAGRQVVGIITRSDVLKFLDGAMGKETA